MLVYIFILIKNLLLAQTPVFASVSGLPKIYINKNLQKAIKLGLKYLYKGKSIGSFKQTLYFANGLSKLGFLTCIIAIYI